MGTTRITLGTSRFSVHYGILNDLASEHILCLVFSRCCESRYIMYASLRLPSKPIGTFLLTV